MFPPLLPPPWGVGVGVTPTPSLDSLHRLRDNFLTIFCKLGSVPFCVPIALYIYILKDHIILQFSLCMSIFLQPQKLAQS